MGRHAIEHRYTGLFVLVMLVVSGSFAHAQDQEQLFRSAQRLLHQGHDLVLDEEWEDAAVAFSGSLDAFMALARDNPISASSFREMAQEPFFWKCFAEEKRGFAEEDVAECYEIFLLRYPDSKWADDARRNLALAQRAQEAARAAAKVLRSARGTLQVLTADTVVVRTKSRERGAAGGPGAQEQVLMTTIYALAEPGNEEVLPQLRRLALASESEQVQLAALRALHRVGTRAAQQVLVDVVRSDARAHVRGEAIMALADADAGRAATREVAESKSEEPVVREAAVRVLSRQASSDVVALLGRIAGDATEEAGLRRVAVEALDRIGTEEARAVLIELLEAEG